MAECIRNQDHRLYIDQYGKKFFHREKDRKLLFTLSPMYEFALQIECEGYSGMVTSHHCKKEETGYEHELFTMEVHYSMDETAAYKKLRLIAKKDMMVRYAQTELSRSNVKPGRGGEGQPFFLEDRGFISIVFPAAQNRIDGDTIRLEQAPYKTLKKGESFDFFPVVYGFSTEDTIEQSFLQYIIRHKKKTPSGLRIYSDWGAHDELAEGPELDEAMALRLLENLRKGKELGVEFDYYLMDAHWFEESDLYHSFRKRKWPEGPERFLNELKELGMKFGLWFDVNMGMLNPPEDAPRYDKDSTRICLGYEETARKLFEGMEAQIDQSDCTMLKLDFAFFDCQDESHPVHAGGEVSSKEPAIRNLLEGLDRLYRKTPNLIVLAYNVFTTKLDYILSVDPNRTGHSISPWWCLYLDYLYCGDPRPSEIPTGHLGDSVIYYTDSMIRGFREALLPDTASDDHGTMIGTTNTIYYLGKGRFRDSWIMNISRGARRTLLYGELELLEEEDWKFLKDSQKFFDFTCQEDVVNELILGNPKLGQPYGYGNGNGREGYFTLVNPTDRPVVVSLVDEVRKLGGEIELRRYYSGENFTEGEYQSADAAREIRLGANEVVVYQWRQTETPLSVQEGYLVLDKNSTQTLVISEKAQRFSLNLSNEFGSPLRFFGGEKMPIEVDSPDTDVEIKCIYDKLIWSGCSWNLYQIDRKKEAGAVTIRIQNQRKVSLYIRWSISDGEKISEIEIDKSDIT